MAKEFLISPKSVAPPKKAKGPFVLKPGWLLTAIVTFTACAYVGTLRFNFVYDDDGQIVGNNFIQFWRHVPGYFISSVWTNIFPRQRGNYYRPLFLLWLRVNDALFGLKPMGWHFTTILLHLLATFLVYLVLRKVTGKFTVAAMAAMIFGVHPIHAEVVAWVSGVTESLAAVFFLSAFLCYLKAREAAPALWMTLSCFLFAIALFSKETAIILPALVFGHCWIYGVNSQTVSSGTFKRLLRCAGWALPYAPVALFYFFARLLVLGGLGHALVQLRWTTIVLTAPSMIAFYFKKWFLPIGLDEFYDMPYWSTLNFWHVILPALCVGLLFLALWLARRQLGSRDVAFGTLWTFLPLLPVLDPAVFARDELVHDRYFYLPSVGASLLVALVVERLTRRAESLEKPRALPAYIIVFLALGLTLAALTSYEASFWVNDLTLMSRGHTLAPKSPVARNDYGVELAAFGADDQARDIFQEAIAADPSDYSAYFNLGRICYQERKYAEAEQWLRQSIALNPKAADVHLELGLVELRTDRLDAALPEFRLAAELRSTDPTYLFAYGVVLAESGDCAHASQMFRSALEIRPGDAEMQLQLARCRQPAVKK